MAVVNNKENRVPWYGYNGGDLAVSHRDYYDMVDPLLDERLSPRMQMKFKNLYEVNSNGMFAVAIVATPIALALTRLYVGSSVLMQAPSTAVSATSVASGPLCRSSGPSLATVYRMCP
jgi:hypothetical protein